MEERTSESEENDSEIDERAELAEFEKERDEKEVFRE